MLTTWTRSNTVSVRQVLAVTYTVRGDEFVAEVPLDAKICMLGVGILEVFRRRKAKGQNLQGQTRAQIILVNKDGIWEQRVEPLLVG